MAGTPEYEAGDELDHRIVDYPDGSACTIFPRGATEADLVTTWITAEEGSFLALDDAR